MSDRDDQDYRDEGIGPEPKPFQRKLAEYHPWTEALGLLLYQTISVEDPKSDLDIVRCVQSLEQLHPVLAGQIWQLVEAAKNPICRSRSADERLFFYTRADQNSAAPMAQYCVCLPLDEVELHNLLQGERV